MTTSIFKPAEFHQVKIPTGWVYPFLNKAIFMTSQALSFFSGVSISISDKRVVYHYHLALFEKTRPYIDGAFRNERFFRGIFITEVDCDTYYRGTGGYKSAPETDFRRPGGSNRGKWHKSASFQQITHQIAMICKARAIIIMLAILQGFNTFKIHAFNALPIRLSVSLTNTGTTTRTTLPNLYTSHAFGVFSIETLPKAVFALVKQALVYTKRPNPSS